MFSFCLNNPILFIDPFGNLAFPGEIHNEVVKHIKERYNLYSEQTILYNVGWGRADLISNDGYVWKVKRDKPNQIENGKKQVKNI